MKKKFMLMFLAAGSLISADRIKPVTSSFKVKAATCVGASPCKACKNCKYCKRCAKDGLTCGICKK